MHCSMHCCMHCSMHCCMHCCMHSPLRDALRWCWRMGIYTLVADWWPPQRSQRDLADTSQLKKCMQSREQSAECRVQRAECRVQSAECREQRAESREQRVESREQRVERCRGAECRKQRAEKVGIIRVAMQLAPPIMRLTGTAPPWALPVREMIGGASCIATHCSTRLSASTTFSLCSVWIAAESIIATRSTPGHPQLRDRERLRHNVRWTQ